MKRIKTPFDQLREVMETHWTQPIAGKSAFSDEQLDSIKAMAAELPLKNIEEDVPDPPKTDGELLEKAYLTTRGWDAYAAEFLRLRRERDGEPLEVTTKWLIGAYHDAAGCGGTMTEKWGRVADRINAHRGVGPLPKVTAEMVRAAVFEYFDDAKIAEILNAELAKAAKEGDS